MDHHLLSSCLKMWKDDFNLVSKRRNHQTDNDSSHGQTVTQICIWKHYEILQNIMCWWFFKTGETTWKLWHCVWGTSKLPFRFDDSANTWGNLSPQMHLFMVINAALQLMRTMHPMARTRWVIESCCIGMTHEQHQENFTTGDTITMALAYCSCISARLLDSIRIWY